MREERWNEEQEENKSERRIFHDAETLFSIAYFNIYRKIRVNRTMFEVY